MAPTAEDLRHNFDLERGLVARLKAPSALDRRSLYSEVYDEYFRQGRNVGHAIDDARGIARQVRRATRFLPKDRRYFEPGVGTCRVAELITKSAKVVYIASWSLWSDVKILSYRRLAPLAGDGSRAAVNHGA